MHVFVTVDGRVKQAAILVSQGKQNLGRVKNACGDGRDGHKDLHPPLHAITLQPPSPWALFTHPRFHVP